MALITSIVLALFAAYGFAWYSGSYEGSFPFILFLAVVVTGLYWLAERFYFLPKRKKTAREIYDHAYSQREKLKAQGIPSYTTDEQIVHSQQEALRQPWWLDWTAGIFPVLLVVFLLRSFAYEPFKIPSGSMIPTLYVGDLILVNKYTYGLRLPVINKKITEGNAPKRGDVMVFRYPPQPNLDYIKRVVGIPGDEVSYLNKELRVNGKLYKEEPMPDFLEQDAGQYAKQFQEDGSAQGAPVHRILTMDDRPAYVPNPSEFEFKNHCEYSATGVVCKVPEGHYFMMGDNRDNSLDSRYWGFVPEANIVGKASLVWMNFNHLDRIGSFQ